MNVLVISSYGLYSNLSSSFVHAQAKAYRELGHQVRSLIFLPAGKLCKGSRFFPQVQIIQQDGVELCYLRCVSLSNFGVAWFNTTSALLTLRTNMSKVLEGFTPHVIHAHAFGIASEAGAYLKKKLACPLVVTTHGGDTSTLVAQGKLTQLKPLADQANHIAAVSSALAEKLRACGTKTPVSVILNGFRVENIDKSFNKQPLSMIQVCNLNSQKKVDVTIRAFAGLYHQHSEATLDIVGSGSEMERLQKLCQELGVESKVRFYGFRPNADALTQMAKTQFFCMPSVNEGFGIVYLEAMASGCITIGTEGEGITDLIIHGVNGFLVPPDNSEAIIQVIEWCIQNPEKATAVAKQGCRDVRELTWQHNAQQYIKLFGEII